LLSGSWVIGHLLGYIIMGIALIRSRAIPLWAAILIIVGIPFQAAAYGAHVSVLQLICFALIFIGSIPATLAMLKGSEEETFALWKKFGGGLGGETIYDWYAHEKWGDLVDEFFIEFEMSFSLSLK
jgi:hypothetical protein